MLCLHVSVRCHSITLSSQQLGICFLYRSHVVTRVCLSVAAVGRAGIVASDSTSLQVNLPAGSRWRSGDGSYCSRDWYADEQAVLARRRTVFLLGFTKGAPCRVASLILKIDGASSRGGVQNLAGMGCCRLRSISWTGGACRCSSARRVAASRPQSSSHSSPNCRGSTSTSKDKKFPLGFFFFLIRA